MIFSNEQTTQNIFYATRAWSEHNGISGKGWERGTYVTLGCKGVHTALWHQVCWLTVSQTFCHSDGQLLKVKTLAMKVCDSQTDPRGH